MKTMEYISPSRLRLWAEDKETFYLRYLSPNRPPNDPQTQAMSIGSSFDAYVKAYLHETLFGKGNDPKYGFEALFEAQVEPHHRDWAREHGQYCFDQYKESGVLADLMLELRAAQGCPRFEFEVRGAVHGYREGQERKIAQVVFLGKPDITFTNAAGAHVIYDLKVNGYCANRPHSPKPGYLRLRSAGRTNHGMHKKCQPMMVHGMMINLAGFLEDVDASWAAQLAIYAWLCGESVGSMFITGIDQLACDNTGNGLPKIRIAEHRCFVSEKFQLRTFAEAAELQEIVESGWIFRDMSREDSMARCEILDKQLEALRGDGTTNDQWFAAATRGGGW